ncbi:GGDEF domain-containing protein [Roseibium denhamense]|uniref:diguanylate cyclase n=1 Tax=Roseibium denhamense TaxID=76305 RepID=A0ABY1NW83_9HYPH|nr:GGDEF domain-containing protein [Roseibium denhamense]MTI04810.1 GGDEF domain-containing protein [Roseibium denhamense]SMP19123.1 diguanylate cyclase (GGDEF) domain-containing protein [Roseibium denhamense]
MTQRDKKASDFTLFDNEDRVLERAETILHGLDETTELIKTLSTAYKRAVREQKRMVRLCDRMQEELLTVKERLEGEVTAREKLAEEFRIQAITDNLTGIYNRGHFLELCTHELKSRVRTQAPLSVALMDIDRFKQINDAYGHAGGDEALRVVARTLEASLRQSDVVARWGGEEFGLLMPNASSEDAHKLADRLRKTLSEIEITSDGTAFTLTASFGVATFTGPSPSESRAYMDAIDELFKCADDGLYRAKGAGRNQVQSAECNVCSDELDTLMKQSAG